MHKLLVQREREIECVKVLAVRRMDLLGGLEQPYVRTYVHTYVYNIGLGPCATASESCGLNYSLSRYHYYHHRHGAPTRAYI